MRRTGISVDPAVTVRAQGHWSDVRRYDLEEEEETEDIPSERFPPALGERSAMIGYGLQYQVAAELLLKTLTDEILEWFELQNPEAGRLDDFMFATPGRVDAYQIKWSEFGGQMALSDFKANLKDVISSRRELLEVYPDRTVIGHLYTDRVATNTRISASPEGQTGASLAKAMLEVLIPATEGAFDSIDDAPGDWRWLLSILAIECGITEAELITELRYVRFDFGKPRPSTVGIPASYAPSYREIFTEVHELLLAVAVETPRPGRITREQVFERISESTRQWLELRSGHEFPPPRVYEPIRATVEGLNSAIDQFYTGYVALIGSPGSGKSTLLTEELRGRDDLVCRYYAYVPKSPDFGTIRAEPESFLHDLVLTLERGTQARGPGPPDFDVHSLSQRLIDQLDRLHDRYIDEGMRSIILVDGLDHAERQQPAGSFLSYLPHPDALPEGVLIVLGSQTVRELNSEIRAHLEETGRTVTMSGLGRAEVEKLCNVWGVSVDPDNLWRITEGHPLVLTYLLKALSSIPAEEQAAKLASLPVHGGDVEQFYRGLWDPMERDAELVDLLGFVSRVRGAIDLHWLEEHGQAHNIIRKLDDFTYLFKGTPERLYFFHPSFKLFLQEHTSILLGAIDPNENVRFHRLLAEMCRSTDPQKPQSWDLLFHLSCADEHGEVLAVGTPEYFRTQLLALRPPELVNEDIRLTVRSLAYDNNPMALVRLAIAAGELAQRNISLPEKEKYLSLLVRTGQGIKAIEHIEVERESLGEEDQRTVHLRIALQLRDEGLTTEAEEIIEASEPFELLRGGSGAMRVHGPYALLYAWARAAAVLKGVDAVIAAAEAISIPEEARGPRNMEEDTTPIARANMLIAAADELDFRGEPAEAAKLLSALDLSREPDKEAWLSFKSWRRSRLSDPVSFAKAVNEVAERFDPPDLTDNERVLFARDLIRAGEIERAQDWIEGVSQPELSTEVYHIWQNQQPLYNFVKVSAALGKVPEPEEIAPPPQEDWQWGWVDITRVMVLLARLDGRILAGEEIGADAFAAETQKILRIFDNATKGSHTRRWEVSEIRPHVMSRLLIVAASGGRDTLQAAWRICVDRWEADPSAFHMEGPAVIRTAIEIGFVPRKEMDELIERLEGLIRTGTDIGGLPDALMGLAEIRLLADEREKSLQLLNEAISGSLVVYQRKDYQLSSWIELLGPCLDGDTGAQLVRWLAGALVDLNTGGIDLRPIRDAAETLLLADALRRPGHSWGVSSWLRDNKILDWDTQLSVLLQSTVEEAAGPLWWIVLAGALVPIAYAVPEVVLDSASEIAGRHRGVEWLADRLSEVLESVLVEAPPNSVVLWKEVLADCAASNRISMDRIGLPAEADPALRPPRTRYTGTDEEQRNEFLANHDTVEKVLAGARVADFSDLNSPWDEAVAHVVDDMNIEQVREAADIIAGLSKSRIKMMLARRALDLGATDTAVAIAEKVLSATEPHAWLRNWDGGSIVKAFTLLGELDPVGTRERAYRRFAGDASSDYFLLGEVAKNLPNYLDLFGIDDREALCAEVVEYLKVLLEEPETLPADDFEGVAEDASRTLSRSLRDLLASPYRLAVSAAQRALVSALEGEDSGAQALLVEILLGEDEELILRALSVIETAVAIGISVDGDIADGVVRWTGGDNLALRVAARRIALILDLEPVEIPRKELPASYGLVIQGHQEVPGHLGGRPMGKDDLERILVVGEHQLRGLARAGGVDPDILQARLVTVARSLAGDGPVVDEAPRDRDSVLGWQIYKPSMILWDWAAARLAAELVDAERLSQDDALILSTGPLYDPMLISEKCCPWPDAVPHIPGLEDRWIKPEDWLEGMDGAEDPLTKATEGDWVVIGEHTEIRFLSDEIPRELRTQCLGPVRLLEPLEPSKYLCHTPVLEALDAEAPLGSQPVVFHWDPAYRGPSQYMIIDPSLAQACGWERTDEEFFGWKDDAGLVIRTLHWRSGWLDSSQWRDHVEVGEGFLVLAHSRALPELARVLGGDLGTAWRVKRDFLAPGQPDEEISGVISLFAC